MNYMNAFLMVLQFVQACCDGTTSVGAVAGTRHDQPETTQRNAGDFELRVQSYASGQCTLVFISPQRQSNPVVDSCHGWRATTCSGITFVVSDEARLARGTAIIVPDRSQQNAVEVVDINLKIEQRLRADIARPSLLDLSFANASCTGDGIRVPYDGSFTDGDDSGASSVNGYISIRRSGVGVEVQRAD